MDCEESEMTRLENSKRWICLGIMLYLTGCGVESGGDISISPPNAPDSNAARVELASDAVAVDYEGSITLSWTTNKVQDCIALGDWSGEKAASGVETINSLVADSRFELACTEIQDSSNLGTSDVVAYKGKPVKDQVDVSVRGPKPPTLVVSASPTAIPANGSTTISWSSQHASECVASGGWSGGKATSGTQAISGLITSSTFILTCSGKGGSTNESVSITVVAQSTAWVSVTANSSSLPYGGSTTLSWDSGNTSGCKASGDWSGDLATAGSQSTGSLLADSTFNLTCTGAGGSATDSIKITVAAPSPALSFSASPGSVNENGSTTLSWTGTYVTNCTASGNWSGDKVVAGTEVIGPITTDSQFILTCSGPDGAVSKTVGVSVLQAGNGTALLSWMPPTQNTDGSALTDLAGYRIHYGTSPGSYSETITLDNPGLSSYMVENLVSGNWFFAMTSLNSLGIESDYSMEVSKTIN
jgi:trimeric autotransporter adhesin